jgi:hypothetical protein
MIYSLGMADRRAGDVQDLLAIGGESAASRA